MDQIGTETGKLIVKVRTGFGIYPLADVFVTVISEDGENSTVVANVFTDEGGSTGEILLELPPVTDRLAPRVYNYTVETSKPGYQKVIFHGTEVYPGVTTVQLINMAALPDMNGVNLDEYDLEVVVNKDGDFGRETVG